MLLSDLCATSARCFLHVCGFQDFRLLPRHMTSDPIHKLLNVQRFCSVQFESSWEFQGVSFPLLSSRFKLSGPCLSGEFVGKRQIVHIVRMSFLNLEYFPLPLSW